RKKRPACGKVSGPACRCTGKSCGRTADAAFALRPHPSLTRQRGAPMSVYIIQPEEADALGKVLPRLSEDEAAAVRAAALQRVEVDTVRRAWRVVLSGPRPVPDATLRKLEERLLQSVTGVDRVTFVFERQAQGSEPDVAAPAGDDAAAPAPAAVPAAAGEPAAADRPEEAPPPEEPPPLEELDEDQ